MKILFFYIILLFLLQRKIWRNGMNTKRILFLFFSAFISGFFFSPILITQYPITLRMMIFYLWSTFRNLYTSIANRLESERNNVKIIRSDCLHFRFFLSSSLATHKQFCCISYVFSYFYILSFSSFNTTNILLFGFGIPILFLLFNLVRRHFSYNFSVLKHI